jgi:hypothetical protein
MDSSKRMREKVQDKTEKKYEQVWLEFQMFLEHFGVPEGRAFPWWLIATYVELVARSSISQAKVHLQAMLKQLMWQGIMLPREGAAVLKELAKTLDRQCQENSSPEKVDALPRELVLYACTKAKEIGGRWWTVAAGLLLGIRAVKRAASLYHLRLRDVSEIENGLKVYFPTDKTHPSGYIVVIENALAFPCPCEFLRELIKMRKRQGAGLNDLLFVKNRGRRTDSAFWSARICELQNELDDSGVVLKGIFSSRSMRVTGPTEMIRMGFTEEQVKALGGWLSIANWTYVRQQAVMSKNLSTRLFGTTSVASSQYGENDE